MDVTFASDLVTFDGSLVAIVWPDPADVRAGVKYGPSGTEFTGTLIVGSGSSATPEEIAAAVVTALQATTIPVDVKKINTVTLTGAGVSGDPMRPA